MKFLLGNPVVALSGLLAAVLLCLSLYGWGRHDGKALEQGRSAVAYAKAEERIAALERARDQVTREIDDEWKPKAAALEARVAALSTLDLEPIRLCIPRRDTRPTPVPGTAPQPDGPPVEGGPGVQAGEDIRAPLLVYAADCERWRGQLTDTQDWIRRQMAVR